MRAVIADAVLLDHDVTERLGLSVSAGQFMTSLEQYGPLTPGQLGRLSGLNSGTVTGVLDRLERAGYARRDRHPTDRRKVVVTLDHERIDREIGPLYAAQAQRLDDVLDHYDAGQLEIIADFLTRLGQHDEEPEMGSRRRVSGGNASASSEDATSV
jgi:DNA-binding MarR family transcriptional regulator